MNNKILLGALIGLGVFGTIYLTIDNKEKSLENTTTPKEIVNTQKQEKKNIEILYLEEDKEVKKTDLVKKQETRKTSVEVEDDVLGYDDEKEILAYIEKKKLKNVTLKNYDPNKTKPRFQVFSSISLEEAKKNKDKFTPPSTPVIISGRTVNGDQYTVVVDGDIHALDPHLAIADTNEDDTINNLTPVKKLENNENEAESSEEIIFSAPPQIGVNQ